MPLNSAMFWKVRAMPLRGRLVGPHAACGRALAGDRALLRVVEAVDHVEHRGLAGAVGADDGADLAAWRMSKLMSLERLHAAERAAMMPSTLEQHVAEPAVPLRPALVMLAAHHRARAAAMTVCGVSRIATSASTTPVRPSSKVTSASTWTLVGAAVERLDQRRVLLGDEAPPHLAGAGELAVVGIELLVQEQEAADLRAASAGSAARLRLTRSTRLAISS